MFYMKDFTISDKWVISVRLYRRISAIILISFNPFVTGVHLKVTHTETNFHLSAASLFKYAWPFSGHHAQKG